MKSNKFKRKIYKMSPVLYNVMKRNAVLQSKLEQFIISGLLDKGIDVDNYNHYTHQEHSHIKRRFFIEYMMGGNIDELLFRFVL